MSCVVYITNKKTGNVYAYESVSFRDPITHVPKSKRTYIGRVDPVTRELIDPEKAERLKNKRAEAAVRKAEAALDKPSAEAEGVSGLAMVMEQNRELIKQVRALTRLVEQQRDEIARLGREQQKTRKTLASIGNLIQKSLAE